MTAIVQVVFWDVTRHINKVITAKTAAPLFLFISRAPIVRLRI
jgi:hypothetical protein